MVTEFWHLQRNFTPALVFSSFLWGIDTLTPFGYIDTPFLIFHILLLLPQYEVATL